MSKKFGTRAAEFEIKSTSLSVRPALRSRREGLQESDEGIFFLDRQFKVAELPLMRLVESSAQASK